MARRIPPLNALRAFEAAARHLSFAKAAEELNVTPAAISHQVKSLEAFVGVPLFRRLTRAVMLTDAGQAALPLLYEAFDRLEQAAERMRTHDEAGELKLSAAPSFTAKWLVPRLDRFAAAHPEIDVRIDATNQVIDLAREDVDIAIRYGPGGYPKHREDPLLEDEAVVPVCSPALCEGPDALTTPEDLRRQTLLHIHFGGQRSTWPTWEMWLRAAGIAGIDATRGPVFAQESLALQAAIAGQGVALASSMFVAEDIAAGRLVRPFDLGIPLEFGYFVISLEANADRPKVAAFRDWLLEEAGRDKR
ncbi:MAG: transcriptional regulator GcvA [Alphaproteobacteria bacterium]|nr:transcriptional regulator GcvA [Alphaproteobacteria bacterium]